MTHNPIRPWRNIDRRKSRQIRVGNVLVGGDAPISVQTMTNTLTTDAAATIAQIQRAANAGADIVRVSTPDVESTRALRQIVAEDGLLVIDLPNAGDTFASQDSDAMILDRKFIDPETGHLILLFSSSVLDRTTQLLYVDWIYDEVQEDGSVKRLLAPHVLRYYFYAEIKLLLERCGFAIEEVFGGTDEEPFEDGSERMIIYARPE